jgi:hypothetical protein
MSLSGEFVGFGLLEKNARGRLSAPFDKIVIHARLRNVTCSAPTSFRRNWGQNNQVRGIVQ